MTKKDNLKIINDYYSLKCLNNQIEFNLVMENKERVIKKLDDIIKTLELYSIKARRIPWYRYVEHDIHWDYNEIFDKYPDLKIVYESLIISTINLYWIKKNMNNMVSNKLKTYSTRYGWNSLD